ncbi:hypothetical protein [Lichenihabitans psoromatis]|uniref:hypothetical protein n=1 Tax=Lichenihabitans psoromatis TaxID=2528642 RepID=UPI001035AC12|nr:hypothetical protein [Lichenihabitans psoromatis]
MSLPVEVTYRGKSRVGQYTLLGYGPQAIVTVTYRLSKISKECGNFSVERIARNLILEMVRGSHY